MREDKTGRGGGRKRESKTRRERSKNAGTGKNLRTYLRQSCHLTGEETMEVRVLSQGYIAGKLQNQEMEPRLPDHRPVQGREQRETWR